MAAVDRVEVGVVVVMGPPRTGVVSLHTEAVTTSKGAVPRHAEVVSTAAYHAEVAFTPTTTAEVPVTAVAPLRLHAASLTLAPLLPEAEQPRVVGPVTAAGPVAPVVRVAPGTPSHVAPEMAATVLRSADRDLTLGRHQSLQTSF